MTIGPVPSNWSAKTPGGDPYRRQAPVFEPTKVAGAKGVKMSKIEPDQSPIRFVTITAESI